MITLLIDEWIPNATTLEAMAEPIKDLTRYGSAEKAIDALGI
ncbi:MAG: hypothetical protein ABIT37_14110 [Luteolibacter sp.]